MTFVCVLTELEHCTPFLYWCTSLDSLQEERLRFDGEWWVTSAGKHNHGKPVQLQPKVGPRFSMEGAKQGIQGESYVQIC